MNTEPSWIFAYGSLLWRPDFAYAEVRRAFVRGWVRRFWQGSTDHRGTEAAPGRVVTLVECEDSQCWGLAYRLAPERATETLDLLDHRERGGYTRLVAPLYFGADMTGAEQEPGLLYLAGPRNHNYLGPAPLTSIARQVASSRGPSGENWEYVEKLAQTLRALELVDAHVFELESLVAIERNRLKG